MPSIMKLAQASNDTVHMVGKHGIGKSQVVEQFASETDTHIEILMLSQNEVADLIGMPYEEEGTTYWSQPSWLKRMHEASAAGKNCVLFLDELARSPLEVRQSALQLVLDRRIHEHRLPERMGIKTLVVAADNPSDEYQTDELDPALLDRFMSYEVEVDVDGWLKWARTKDLESVVTDYIAEFPEKLHFMTEDDKDKGATPRAWAKLSDVLRNIDLVDRGLIMSVINSKIGKTVGANFFHFYNNYAKVVKVEDVLANIGKAKIETQKEQEKAAKKLGKITKDIEAISANELGEKIKAGIKKGEVSYDVLSVFLESLNLEIMTTMIKAWKTDDEEFYFSYAKQVPDRYIFRKIVSKV